MSTGINVVYSQISYVTHHATPDYTITASIAQSLLLAAQFITSDWLSEVIRLGNLPVNNDPSNGVSLEQTFLLPPIAKFRPAFSAVLPSTLKVFKVWEPNEGRFNMFKGHRFISVDEKPNAELRDMIRCGGGEYEAFIVSGGKQKFHHALSKARRVTSDAVGNGKGLVIVADENAMNTAIGPDAWKELLSEAKRFVLQVLLVYSVMSLSLLASFGLRFIAVENILRSVINLDISLVDSTIDSEEG
jgi:hypothetical protein